MAPTFLYLFYENRSYQADDDNATAAAVDTTPAAPETAPEDPTVIYFLIFVLLEL